MPSDPADFEFDPPRGLLLARILAVVGWAAAGACVYLWIDARSRGEVEVEALISQRDRGIAEATDAARRVARDDLARELATERASHARELEQARGERGSALAAKVAVLGNERDRLVAALESARRRSQRLRTDMKRLQSEMETALASGEEKVRAEARRWAGELAKVTRDLGEAEAEAQARANAVRDLEARMADPREGALGPAVIANIERVYAAVDHSKPVDVELVVRALGRGAWLQPFLADHYDDPARGLTAMAHTARLDAVDHRALIDDLASSERKDVAFSRAAGRALLAGMDDPMILEDRLTTALGHRSVSVRLAAVEAATLASAGGSPVFADRPTAHPALVAALGNGEPVVVDRALSNAMNASSGVRQSLIDRLPTLELGPCRAAWMHLLAGPEEDAPALAGALVRRPELLDFVAGEPEPTPSELARLLGELLARPSTDAVSAPRQRIVTLLFGGEENVDWGRVCEDPRVRRHVIAAARREVHHDRLDERREQARLMLPPEGLVLDPADRVERLVRIACPAHIPFLVETAPHASARARVAVAATLHGFGHPKGRVLLDGLVNTVEPSVRGAALNACAALRLPNAERLIHLRLREPSPVREAAIRAASTMELPLPAEFVPLLAACASPWVEPLLAALSRGTGEEELRPVLLRALEDGAVLDGDVVAGWLFEPERRPDPETCRAAQRHAHPSVRARAIAVCRDLGGGGDPAARVAGLDPFVDDPDLRVRIEVARSLAGVRHDLARTTLVRLARDSSPWVRDEAVEALGWQETYHVIPVLRAAAHDDSPYVRNAAYLSLLAHGVKTESKRVLDALDDPRLGLRTRRTLDRILGRRCAGREEYARALAEL